MNTDGDTVSTAVSAALGCVVDNGSEEKTDGDTELVARDEGTANLARGNLGHVEDDDGRDETDTETSDETAGDDETETLGLSNLENDTNHVDTAS